MKISLCLIVKDEEKRIEKCIKSVISIVDEVIVIDTGSEDSTKLIASELGAKIYDYKWNDNFAAARNFGISKCNGKWIIFLDADEYYSDESVSKIRSNIKNAEKLNLNVIYSELINIDEKSNILISTVKNIRIFRNDKSIRYKGNIHESLYNIKGKLKGYDAASELKVFHVGYSKEIIKERNKDERNVNMLKAQLIENPTSSNIHFYLVESLQMANMYDEAFEECKQVFKFNNGTLPGIYEKSYAHLMRLHIYLKNDLDELLKIYLEAIEGNENYPDYDAIIGNYYATRNENDLAIEHFEKCIYKMNNYTSQVESWVLTGAKEVYVALSNLYLSVGRDNDALKILIDILKVYKDDVNSLKTLMNILIKYERVEDVIAFIFRMYDVNNIEDKSLVYKACLQSKNVELCKYISLMNK
ncbi:MAG: glycosyltransferase [Clostridium sp.]